MHLFSSSYNINNFFTDAIIFHSQLQSNYKFIEIQRYQYFLKKVDLSLFPSMKF